MSDLAHGARGCEVCGSRSRRVLFLQRFAGAPAGALLSGYDVAVCVHCGFGYADGLPAQRAFDEYYERMSKYEYAHQGGAQVNFDAQRFPAAAAFIGAHAPDPGARILDVGCSNGGLLHALQQSGYARLTGLDPSPACARTAARLYGLRVVTGSLFAPPPDLGAQDLVLLAAVLEHVRDLRAALRRIRGLLAPGGLLYLEVPDATRFSAATDAPFQEFSVEHVNYFSTASLRNLLHAAGFDQIVAEPTPMAQGESTIAHVINAMFRMVADAPRPPLARDTETEPALAAYIGASRAVEERIHAAIAPWVRSGRGIVVWGVGTHTQRLLATSALAQAKIVAFVDSNARYQGKLMNGVPVLAPEALRGRPEPILISSRFFQKEIERQIRDTLRLGNELILLYDV
jgi:2-polyprenyl-3-methyl-5-hydroxy-6-metoxy-1,4-benzoquinol methylase